jgi:hypothetical protein
MPTLSFLPSLSTLPSTSTSTSTATVSVACLRAIPPSPEEEEDEPRSCGLKGSRHGTPVLGLAPLAPDASASASASASGSSTPRSVSFAVEPPKYSEKRERSREGGKVERTKKKRKGGEGKGWVDERVPRCYVCAPAWCDR